MPSPELAHLPRLRRPSLLNAAEYWFRNTALTERLANLGDRFVLTMPGTGDWLCLTNPDDIEVVFRAESDAVHFAEAVRMLSPHELVLGPKQLTALDGPVHVAKRRMLLPAFHGEALKSYEATMQDRARELVARWPIGRTTDSLERMQQVTLEIIMATVFGVTDNDRLARLRDAIVDLTAEVGSRRFVVQMAISNARNDRFKRPFPRIEARKAAVDAIVMEELEERRNGSGGDGDVLGRILAMRDEGGRPLGDDEICDQMRMLLIGGHDTTAGTISWVIERITRHPDVLSRLEATVRDGDDSYLDAVICETLRMRPISPMTVRLTKEPLELDGLTVPAETLVAPYIALVHRRPEIYPDPLEFRPERFHGVRPGTYSWIPFGGGTRRCIGASMAMFEARIIVRTMLQELDLSLAQGKAEALRRRQITFVPAKGGTVAVERRKNEESKQETRAAVR